MRCIICLEHLGGHGVFNPHCKYAAISMTRFKGMPNWCGPTFIVVRNELLPTLGNIEANMFFSLYSIEANMFFSLYNLESKLKSLYIQSDRFR